MSCPRASQEAVIMLKAYWLLKACPALWQALYMDYLLSYSNQPGKVCVLSLFSFYKAEIDAQRGPVTCHSVHNWNQEAGSRLEPGTPIPGLTFSSSGEGWGFTAWRASSLPYMGRLSFYTDLNTSGLYVFSSLADVLDWFLMMATVCFKEPEIKNVKRWAFLATESLICAVR